MARKGRRRGCRLLGLLFLDVAASSSESNETRACTPEEHYQDADRDSSGWLPIHHAAKNGDVSFLKALKETMRAKNDAPAADCCKAFSELLANTSDAKTPAHIAVEYKQLEFLQWFALMSEWLYSGERHDPGPCMGSAGRLAAFLQKDAAGDTVLSISMQAIIADKEFRADLLDFLVRRFSRTQVMEQIEREMAWTQEFGEWFLEDAFRIKRQLLDRVGGAGFANSTFDLSSARQLARDPPVYAAQDVLTEEECVAVINDAKYMMKPSFVGGQAPVARSKMHAFLSSFDADNDSSLNKTELRHGILTFLDLEVGRLTDKGGGQQINTKTIARVLQIDLDGDGEVNLKTEVFNTTERDMDDFEATVAQIKKQLAGRQVRTNEVFFMPPWLLSGKRAVAKMKAAFGVSDWQIEAAQSLQVVHYLEGAHYGPHFDGKGREVTIFSYLNDVPEGGSTAFPMANVPLTREKIENVSLTDECTASHNCCDPQCRAVNSTDCWQAVHEAKDPNHPRQRFLVTEMRTCLRENGTASWTLGEPGLQVPARRGQSVLWYNYNRDPQGRPHEVVESEHCSCDVIAGEKWGANLWLKDMNFLHAVMRYIRRVRILRRAGWRSGLSELANVGDPSFEDFPETTAGTNAFRRLGKALQKELLGIPLRAETLHGRIRRPFYRQCPGFQEADGTAQDLIRATVHWAESMNLTSITDRRIERLKLDMILKRWVGGVEEDEKPKSKTVGT